MSVGCCRGIVVPHCGFIGFPWRLRAQACYYASDKWAPIYGALLPALAADMAVVNGCVGMFSPSLGCSASYCLVTHPGHHAGLQSCSGYCYLNNAAIVAAALRKGWPDECGKVAIIDVDYHAGNGARPKIGGFLMGYPLHLS